MAVKRKEFKKSAAPKSKKKAKPAITKARAKVAESFSAELQAAHRAGYDLAMQDEQHRQELLVKHPTKAMQEQKAKEAAKAYADGYKAGNALSLLDPGPKSGASVANIKLAPPDAVFPKQAITVEASRCDNDCCIYVTLHKGEGKITPEEFIAFGRGLEVVVPKAGLPPRRDGSQSEAPRGLAN